MKLILSYIFTYIVTYNSKASSYSILCCLNIFYRIYQTHESCNHFVSRILSSSKPCVISIRQFFLATIGNTKVYTTQNRCLEEIVTLGTKLVTLSNINNHTKKIIITLGIIGTLGKIDLIKKNALDNSLHYNYLTKQFVTRFSSFQILLSTHVNGIPQLVHTKRFH